MNSTQLRVANRACIVYRRTFCLTPAPISTFISRISCSLSVATSRAQPAPWDVLLLRLSYVMEISCEALNVTIWCKVESGDRFLRESAELGALGSAVCSPAGTALKCSCILQAQMNLNFRYKRKWEGIRQPIPGLQGAVTEMNQGHENNW